MLLDRADVSIKTKKKFTQVAQLSIFSIMFMGLLQWKSFFLLRKEREEHNITKTLHYIVKTETIVHLSVLPAFHLSQR